jgi:hypothetical protein
VDNPSGAAERTLDPAWPVLTPVCHDFPGRSSVRSLKKDLLEQLDGYQVYAARLRKWDPDSYKLFRRIGMYVLPPDMLADRVELEPAVVRHPPGFGAVGMDLAGRREEDADWIFGRFVYFRKLERPGHDIQRAGLGTVYRCHIYWDDNKDKKLNAERGHGFGADFAVLVTPDGQVHALRMRQSKPQTIRHKRGRDRGHTSQVTHQHWALPDIEAAHGLSVAERIVSLFCMTMNFWAQAAQSSMIRVTATKGALVMPFVVDILRTPDFFRDREPVTIDGKTRRIFHIVRAHVRHTKRGDVGIKTHFAGLRRFRWNGYDIAISVPGREHVDLAEMSVGACEGVSTEEEVAGGFMEQTEFAELVANAIGAPEFAA